MTASTSQCPNSTKTKNSKTISLLQTPFSLTSMAWTRGPTIGRGSSATVSIATSTTYGGLFAVKSTSLSSAGVLQKELSVMSQLNSPYIVKCLGSDITCEQDKSRYNLFLEYIPGGTLHDLITSQGGSLTEKSIQYYSNQILKGLDYLHEKGITHCDIKGHNILIGNNGATKIADFGCAVMKGPETERRRSDFSGTPSYMSPEVARGEEQSFEADIWALGCVIIEMATGNNNPWKDMGHDPVSALYRIGYSNDVPEIPSWFSDTAKDFVRKCLVRDSKKRWSAKELLKHEFFESFEVDCDEFTRKSPTSVLDRTLWDDSMEASCSGSVDGSMDFDLGSDCFEDRIKGLVWEGEFCDLNEEDGDDWVNVRSVSEVEECLDYVWDDDFGVGNNQIEDINEFQEPNTLLMNGESDYEVAGDCDDDEEGDEVVSSFDEDVLWDSFDFQDLLFDSFSDGGAVFYHDDSSLLPVIVDELDDEDVSVSRKIFLERILMEYFSFQSQCVRISCTFFFPHLMQCSPLGVTY